MDLTAVFHEVLSRLGNPKPKASGSDGKRNLFERRARGIALRVEKLESFLVESRSDYMDLLSQKIGLDTMSDRERDKIDLRTQNDIRTVNQLLANFKSDVKAAREGLNGSQLLHFELVTLLLEQYLKHVCDRYAQQKAIRVQRELEFQKMSRLEVNARRKVTRSNHDSNLGDGHISPISETRSHEDLLELESMDFDGSNANHCADENELLLPDGASAVPKAAYESSSDEEELTPEEVQMLEEENAKLFDDLMNVKDTVQQIETKVVKIAELQTVFAEKVLSQKDDIELVSENAIKSTENVKDGNEELRKAIQNQASVRVYVLFFLLVMSFSLLFLDWYNE